MANAAVENKFKELLRGIGYRLKAGGFSKSGGSFRYSRAGNAAVVEFQRSQASTSEEIRFTVNVGVVSGRLLRDWELDVSKAGTAHAHFRQRIGSFLPAPSDKWWTVEAASEPDAMIAELEPLIASAVSLLKSRVLDTDLAALWTTGESQGLKERQREQHLRELQ